MCQATATAAAATAAWYCATLLVDAAELLAPPLLSFGPSLLKPLLPL